MISINSWNSLNFGITSDMIKIADPRIATAPTTIIQLISGAVVIAMITEIIKNNGALNIIFNIIKVTICT